MKIFGLTIKKRYFAPLFVLLVLIAIRAVLPIFVTKYVNKTLQDVEGYTGSISDVDLYLIMGAYRICDLKMLKTNGQQEEPFLEIPVTDLSIEWKSLFHGAIVGEVVLKEPTIHFALGATEATSQTGAEADWVQLVEDLLPININRFEAENGNFNLRYEATQPTTESTFKNISLNITNIRNVEDKTEALPSTIVATGFSPTYSGFLKMNGRAFFLQEFPDINYDASFKKIQLESLNPLFKFYAGMDFEAGEMDLYSEMAIDKGEIKGYFKPIIIDAKIFKWKEEGKSLGQGIKEFFAEGVQEFFENHRKEQTAAKVPVRGNIDQTVTLVWPTIITGLKNAYISALKGEIDNTIAYKNGLEAERIAAEDQTETSEEEGEEKEGFFKRIFGSDDDKEDDKKDDSKNIAAKDQKETSEEKEKKGFFKRIFGNDDDDDKKDDSKKKDKGKN